MDDAKRRSRTDLLLGLTAIPTAAGREGRVVDHVRAWVADRPALRVEADAAGNLMIRRAGHAAPSDPPPVLLTAHLDHPAFAVESLDGGRRISALFLGGVMEEYFEGARVLVHPAAGEPAAGVVVATQSPDPPGRLFRRCIIEVEGDASAIRPDDIATWDLPAPRIENGLAHTPACDDLAAVAAALAALDELLHEPAASGVGVLLTRAEEVGFVGAIAACRLGTIPKGSRVIALENSRSFADSPIGAGPIVRVGDRLMTFSPTLTADVARAAHDLEGVPEKQVGDASPQPAGGFRWQRKLMPGGACEATAYSAYGHEATCVCLPLGNYHNMANLDDVQAAQKAGEPVTNAEIAPEIISEADYHGLVDLLVACGRSLRRSEPLVDRMEKMYAERAYVLGSIVREKQGA